jgi:coiled-coil domain-containing protein 12
MSELEPDHNTALHDEGQDDTGAGTGEAAQQAPVLRFRNYKPRDEALKHVAIEPARPNKPAPAPVVDTSAAVKEPLLNLAPKKPNWDLKRDIEKDLAKLDRQTERAIVELLRRKIAEGDAKQSADAPDLAAAVREQERMESKIGDDDDF